MTNTATQTKKTFDADIDWRPETSRHFEPVSKYFCLLVCFFFFFLTHRVTAAGDKSSSAPAGEHAPSSHCCCSATLPAVRAAAAAFAWEASVPLSREAADSHAMCKSVKLLLRGSARLCASASERPSCACGGGGRLSRRCFCNSVVGMRRFFISFIYFLMYNKVLHLERVWGWRH